jgi:hypothetical protein
MEEYVLMSEPDHLYLRGMPLLVGAANLSTLDPPQISIPHFRCKAPKTPATNATKSA